LDSFIISQNINKEKQECLLEKKEKEEKSLHTRERKKEEPTDIKRSSLFKLF